MARKYQISEDTIRQMSDVELKALANRHLADTLGTSRDSLQSMSQNQKLELGLRHIAKKYGISDDEARRAWDIINKMDRGERLSPSEADFMTALQSDQKQDRRKDTFSPVHAKLLSKTLRGVEGAIRFTWMNPSSTAQFNVRLEGIDEQGEVVDAFNIGHATTMGVDSNVTARFISGTNAYSYIKAWRVVDHWPVFTAEAVGPAQCKLEKFRLLNPKTDRAVTRFEIEANVTFDKSTLANTITLQLLDKEGFEIGSFKLYPPYDGKRPVTLENRDCSIWTHLYSRIATGRPKLDYVENRTGFILPPSNDYWR
jgi:hypothetical protein